LWQWTPLLCFGWAKHCARLAGHRSPEWWECTLDDPPPDAAQRSWGTRHAEGPESWVAARPRTAAAGGRPQAGLGAATPGGSLPTCRSPRSPRRHGAAARWPSTRAWWRPCDGTGPASMSTGYRSARATRILAWCSPGRTGHRSTRCGSRGGWSSTPGGPASQRSACTICGIATPARLWRRRPGQGHQRAAGPRHYRGHHGHLLACAARPRPGGGPQRGPADPG
jgi:hypothetical protein